MDANDNRTQGDSYQEDDTVRNFYMGNDKNYDCLPRSSVPHRERLERPAPPLDGADPGREPGRPRGLRHLRGRDHQQEVRPHGGTLRMPQIRKVGSDEGGFFFFANVGVYLKWEYLILP